MPEFAYIARDLGGRKVSGKVSAGTQQEAIAELSGRQLFPVEVAAESSADARGRSKRIKAAVLTVMFGQLADLLRSGVPLLRALEVLKKQASHAGLVEVLERVRSDVQEGKPLADAMARHPRVFGEMAVSMVRAGSEGGFLEEALERVAEFTEKQDELKGRTQGALAYPVFLGVIGTTVVSILLVFFVPKFEGMFARLRERGELPVMTDWLLAFSSTLQRWWWLVGLAMIVGGYAAWRQLNSDAGRMWADRMKLKIPLAAPIFLNLAVARFCRVLGTMLQNGVPILRSLEISASAAGNRVLADAVEVASQNISAGQSLAQPLAASGHFPPTVVEMIAVAEESATLDTVLIRIADGLERRTWRQLDLLVKLLEPLMLLLLALVVMFLAVALLLPVIKMSTAI
jgi:type II secretory pathway component PulF